MNITEWHNYAKCHVCRMTERNKLNWKVHPFWRQSIITTAATFFMLRARLRWQSKSHEATSRFHSRLAFLLLTLVGLHGITDTISQKSASPISLGIHPTFHSFYSINSNSDTRIPRWLKFKLDSKLNLLSFSWLISFLMLVHRSLNYSVKQSIFHFICYYQVKQDAVGAYIWAWLS